MKPIVSIITPTYNHEKYIAICIESVLKQTYKDWEMIIIDDDSTDRTAQIIKKYTDPRIRYVHQNHLGVYKLGVTYNKALAMAQGEIIAILEGDDCWPPNKLELQVPTFNNHQIILSYGDSITINQYSKILGRYQPSLVIPDKHVRENRPVGTALKELLKPNDFISAQTLCFRKSSLLRIGGFIQPSLVPSVDVSTCYCLALEGEFGYVPEPLGYWRRHPQNVSVAEILNMIEGARYCYDFLTTYQERIQELKIDLDIENLKKLLIQLANKVESSKEFIKGYRHLEIWEKQLARRCFLQYLKRHKKRVTLSLMSLVGIFVSYLNINLIHLISLVVGLMRRYTNKNQNQ